MEEPEDLWNDYVTPLTYENVSCPGGYPTREEGALRVFWVFLASQVICIFFQFKPFFHWLSPLLWERNLPQGWWLIERWIWFSIAGLVVGSLFAAIRYFTLLISWNEYERGYKMWRAATRQKILDERQRQADESRREREEKERKQALALRLKTLVEVEHQVLTAYAQYLVDSDFFGTATPIVPLEQTFGTQLPALPIPNLWLARETRNPKVRSLIGDGSSLPTPPVKGPLTGPCITPSMHPLLDLKSA